jgi:DNA-binding SARP family transcriptional activator
MATDRERARRAGDGACVSLRLLGGFSLVAGQVQVQLAASLQRLVALVALRGPISRHATRSTLWPLTDGMTGGRRLRTSLWRLRTRWPGLVTVAGGDLALGEEVLDDVSELASSADVVMSAETGVPPDAAADVLLRAGPLLPGWHEDWAVLDRERLVTTRMHALEALASRQLLCGRPGAALEAALEAVRADPLRESAHRAVLAAHVADGNFAEAHAHLALAERLMRAELGVRPTAAILPPGLQVGPSGVSTGRGAAGITQRPTPAGDDAAQWPKPAAAGRQARQPT